MLIRPLFKKYQKQILDFANSDYGKRDLGINTDKKIVKFTPDGYHELLGVKNGVATLRATFFSRSPFLKRFELPLTALEIAGEASVYPKQLIRKPSDFVYHPFLSFLTSTTNPDADPESTSVDGWVRYDTTGVSWNTAITAADGHAISDAAGSETIASSYYVAGTQAAQVYRGFFLFDTAALTSGAVISAAVFSAHILPATNIYDGDNDANGFTTLVSSTPASNTGLATADYDQVGSTKLSSDLDTTNAVHNQYNDYTLNATGIAAISKTGVSKFAVREGHDLNNDAPADGTSNYFNIYMSDNGSNKPKLVVTYTLVATGGSLFFNQL